MRSAPPGPGLSRVLFISAFLIATCGLIYELVAGAISSYLLGDSVTWFSLVIGAYLSSMGLGSYLSRYIERNLVARFVEVEVVVALLGGFLAIALFAAFTYTAVFPVVLFVGIGLVGAGVGLELPLLIRILESQTSLRELVARVLFLDYIGALVASVLFPLALLPGLGLLRTGLAFGLVNAGVALWTTFLFPAPGPVVNRLRGMSLAAIALLIGGFAMANRLERGMEQDLFVDPIVLREQTSYQRIVVTSWRGDTRLFLQGALQFSSLDEYRYHEALVHPGLAAVAHPRRVLVMGGGDGMAVREVLRHPEVETVVLVDLDPQMTALFSDREDLASLNHGSLKDPRVHVVNDDAFSWLGGKADPQQIEPFDVVILDFPDPNNLALGKLFTNAFYRLLARHLAPGAAVALQATSPLFSPEAYWCVMRTLEYEGYQVKPYHAYIPAFGEWGFALASRDPLPDFRPLPTDLRFLDDQSLPSLFVFPKDIARRDGPINRLDNQILVSLYEEDWRTLHER